MSWSLIIDSDYRKSWQRMVEEAKQFRTPNN